MSKGNQRSKFDCIIIATSDSHDNEGVYHPSSYIAFKPRSGSDLQGIVTA